MSEGEKALEEVLTLHNQVTELQRKLAQACKQAAQLLTRGMGGSFLYKGHVMTITQPFQYVGWQVVVTRPQPIPLPELP